MNRKVLLYHKIESKPEIGVTNIFPGQFYKHLLTVKHDGHKLQSLEDLFNLTHKRETGNNKCGLTFDDGYTGLEHKVIDMLAETGFSATAFIPVKWIGCENSWDHGRFGIRFRHMDQKALRNWVDAGNETGSHGYTHKRLDLVPVKEWRREILDSRKRLEDITGKKVRWFAPPFGWYDHRLLDRLLVAGYEGIATVRKLPSIKIPDNLLFVQRIPIYMFHSANMLPYLLKDTEPVSNANKLITGMIHRANYGTVLAQKIAIRIRKP